MTIEINETWKYNLLSWPKQLCCNENVWIENPFKIGNSFHPFIITNWVIRRMLIQFYYISSIGRFFGPPLRWRWKMAALPLPAAILDDLICGTGNEVIQDGGRKRKGRHFPPPPQWGSKKPPQVLDDVISGATILDSRWRRHKWRSTDVCPIHAFCRSLTLLKASDR